MFYENNDININLSEYFIKENFYFIKLCFK